jgi:hypothetical protein
MIIRRTTLEEYKLPPHDYKEYQPRRVLAKMTPL